MDVDRVETRTIWRGYWRDQWTTVVVAVNLHWSTGACDVYTFRYMSDAPHTKDTAHAAALRHLVEHH